VWQAEPTILFIGNFKGRFMDQLPLPPRHELRHLKSNWWWFFALGIMLSVFGAVAIAVPAATRATSFIAIMILGLMLMAAGISVIVGAFWTGRWSGSLPLVLIGILYVVAGFVISEHVGESTAAITLFIAASFMVAGAFRIVAALLWQFPQWGWTLLSGLITFLAGFMIYRHFPGSAMWVIGLLIGIEMLFHGLNWLMLGLAIRRLPDDAG
jgi:uncharacterized membrane protein HdeD (DUF308 family)